MSVLVVGADTPRGEEIVEALSAKEPQLRVFVSAEDVAAELRERPGIHVAEGDVSDSSHVEGAATRCFTAVLVTTAACDDRERAFARTDVAVLKGWCDAIAACGVTRAIWVLDPAHADWQPPEAAPEQVVLPLDHPDLAAEVARLDDAAEL
ncbi:MAG: NAD(P)H-binding protein [Acidimicrobiia bacterium]